MNDLDDDDLGVDLTPLIDVIFMLVIFFIMTMTFSLPSIELELPSSETAQREARQDGVLQFSVDAAGAIFCNSRELTLDEVKALLSEDGYQAIALTIDRAAPAQRIVDFADLARQYTGGQLQINTQLADD
ncbi:MAG: biopolymer transporter ExbD [Proteobacteria bacterium]|uniref:Biopolymer transporter ExbD n=1 Tax=Candidatus Avisuccinivibrio stercorigallinarum TaxID=2840704 RepID=A0A9D9D9E1_9GAMM|nr:biopolymer transporter ExbD [Candidatus Avisuccinivibrio stercorigallinarum]